MLQGIPVGDFNVTVTLYEECVNTTNPFFTWKLTQKTSNQEIIFTADDFSPVPWEWNKFTFSATFGATSGLTAGKIPIYPGEYTYQVYEMMDQYDLNLNNAIGIVENGLLIINPYPFEISGTTYSLETQIPDYRFNNLI